MVVHEERHGDLGSLRPDREKHAPAVIEVLGGIESDLAVFRLGCKERDLVRMTATR